MKFYKLNNELWNKKYEFKLNNNDFYPFIYIKGFTKGEFSKKREIKELIQDKRLKLISRNVDLLGNERYEFAIRILGELLEEI